MSDLDGPNAQPPTEKGGPGRKFTERELKLRRETWIRACEIANHCTGGYGPLTPMLIEGPCGWCGHQEFLAHQPRSQVEAALACPTCRAIVASKLGDKTVEILVLSSSPEDVAHVPAVLMEGLVEIAGTEFWKGVSARMPRARSEGPSAKDDPEAPHAR